MALEAKPTALRFQVWCFSHTTAQLKHLGLPSSGLEVEVFLGSEVGPSHASRSDYVHVVDPVSLFSPRTRICFGASSPSAARRGLTSMCRCQPCSSSYITQVVGGTLSFRGRIIWIFSMNSVIVALLTNWT